MKIFWRFERKLNVKAKWMAVLFLPLMLLHSPARVVLGANGHSIEYPLFLTEAGNIFLLEPSLVEEVFWGIVDLKGNRSLSKKRIRYHVLGCQAETRLNQGCKIDRVKLEKRRKRIPSVLKIPVNFTRISTKKIDAERSAVIVNWQPEIFEPPLIKLEDFLADINAAPESRYYRVKDKVEWIQLNPLFEREIWFNTDKKIADSLMRVYRRMPTDNRDAITFSIDFVTSYHRLLIMDYFIQFKADRVTINHQVFQTTERKR